MTHILLPTDFSAAALKATQFAFELFGTKGTRFTLVHAYFAAGYNDPFLPDVAEAMRKSSMEGMTEFKQRCAALRATEKIDLDGIAMYGTLSSVVRDICADKHADIVVMGTRGKAGATLFGSSTSDLVKNCTVPVIAVPDEWEPRPIRKILFADDHGDLDGQSLAPMLEIAQRTQAAVTVAHVRRTYLVEAGGEDRREYANPLAGVPHSFVTVADENVPDALDTLARDGGMDMMAVIHRELGVLDSLLHRSMARKMALHSHVPLLVMQAKE